MMGGDSSQLETAYVVCIHRAFYPAEGPKDCFTYRHPKRSLEETNDRAAALSCAVGGVIAGLSRLVDPLPRLPSGLPHLADGAQCGNSTPSVCGPSFPWANLAAIP